MNIFFKYMLSIMAMMVILGCEKDDPEVVEVDARLQLFFDNFVVEGATRGVKVDYDSIKISGRIEDIQGDNISGQCRTNSIRANELIVDLTFWNNSNLIQREFVIFHELGHCYLDRPHYDDAYDDGTCISMMHSGTGNCNNAWSSTTRSAYLDELFNP